jgi:tetratricopeptide (TPR) repeat protein
VILAVCSSIITYLVQHAEGELVQGYTLMSRAGKACIAYMTYLYKMLWPADLAVIYPFSKYPPGSAKILVSAVGLLFISGLVLWLGRRFPYLVTGWFWYLVTLLPVIGLIQIGQHSVADRYTYIPLIGIFIMVAWGVPRLLEGWKSRKAILCGISASCLAAMIILTTLQLKHWKNSFTIFSQAVAATEDNWVAQNNLGLTYLDAGRIDEAILHLRESIRAKPSFALAYYNLGTAYLKKNEFDPAIEAFTWVLQLDPHNAQAHYSLGQIFIVQGNRQLAMAHYQELQKNGSAFAPSLLELINAFPAIVTTP